MYRAALRSASRPAVAGLRASALRSAPRRFASTSPADKSRSWKGSAVRWALAGGAVYYYSTSTVFAEEAIPGMHARINAATAPPVTIFEAPLTPIDIAKQFSTAPSSFLESNETTELPTVASIVEERKSQAAAKAQKPADSTPKQQDGKAETAAETTTNAGSPAALEEEADQQGAFNPETGEINWDCPCLGGMAHGPCGEEFKTAFSCFVYSNEEPKGMECIDKFQAMQECFRQYPEIYGAELAEADNAEDFPDDLEHPSETQTLREDHHAADTQTVSEGVKMADEQTPGAEPSAAAPRQPTEKPAEFKATDAAVSVAPQQQTSKPAESTPAESKPNDSGAADIKPVKSEPGPSAIPEASIDTTSTTPSRGPKWEDATEANKDDPKPKEA
ncbi:mitochondrial intermembrane space protein Mia40 [Beauveria brongniartii RCEF 3172]|uniref:Mitochondrial intermembrane space import and assembly protein 40 n=1 Tax=Beauveria brongniartii RCEF 3172 TaxID=1081107 RepID=A0A162M3W1_9HYPO|nr:mitochondrial intermembrane space protein Mia40 [Beauveria brongniartii RCEF 3172]